MNDVDYTDDESKETTTKYRVAWKDRIGLTDVWRKDMLACSETFGTDKYPSRVECFRNDLINIKNGPQFSDLVEKYINEDLGNFYQERFEKWKQENPTDRNDAAIIVNVLKKIKYEAYEKLHHYIVQMLENEGFGTYRSSVEEDEMI